jgi:hypothetical protein
MNNITYYNRLVASVERIARHSWYPGMDRAIEDCVSDIEGLVLDGRISEEQGETLRGIFMEANSDAA